MARPDSPDHARAPSGCITYDPSADGAGDLEWAYCFGPGSLTVFQALPSDVRHIGDGYQVATGDVYQLRLYAWQVVGIYSLRADKPDWGAVECGPPSFTRCPHISWAHLDGTERERLRSDPHLSTVSIRDYIRGIRESLNRIDLSTGAQRALFLSSIKEVPMPKWVYAFHEASGAQSALLGGKGANLAEMTRLGLPVPPGFTITTETCRFYRRTETLPQEATLQIAEHLVTLQEARGRRFGSERDPLLVSVRSGAARSMPGMMDTVLNVGLNDRSVRGLTDSSGCPRFAWDCYRRFIEMFSTTVLGLEAGLVEADRDAVTQAASAHELREIVAGCKRTVEAETGQPFPEDPERQLHMAIEAVFRSWDTERARQYRRRHRITDSLGTAVTVQAMVFGNKGDDSGTGVAFTRNPLTGERQPFGDYLPHAQGEDVVSGIRNTLPLETMAELQPRAYRELIEVMKTLERHYRDMMDIEFTVERGQLWVLQCRTGKRSGIAEWVIASDMVDEGLIDEATALAERLTPRKFDELLRPSIRADVKSNSEPLTKGLPASPGATSGRVVFTPDRARSWAEAGDKVILVSRDTTPDDYAGIVASAGVLTAIGGINSHAAVVAREEGVPAVCGAEAIEIHPTLTRLQIGDTSIVQGEWITIDGSDGALYSGRLETQPSVLESAMRGDPEARASRLWHAYQRFSQLARSAAGKS